MNIAIPTNEQPDYAREVMDRLRKDYANVLASVAAVIEDFKQLPMPIISDADLAAYAEVMTRARDINKRLTGFHAAEKAPYLNGGRGCDQFFFGTQDLLERRTKNAVPGIIDTGNQLVDHYMQEKLRIERAKRIAEEEAMRAKLRAAEEAAAAARRAEQEAIEKAARARKEENIQAQRAIAAEQALLNEQARQAAEQLAQAADDARIDALASPADMTRTRLDTGHLATMAQVPYVAIEAACNLDAITLWPFLKEEHILMALKAWAKTKDYKQPMFGAIIEMRNKGQLK